MFSSDDRYFYDPTLDQGKGNYTVQRYLDDLTTRYGGVDSILLWPTYTNIGADARNQFDLFEALPGGLEGVRSVCDQLHARGVHVMVSEIVPVITISDTSSVAHKP